MKPTLLLLTTALLLLASCNNDPAAPQKQTLTGTNTNNDSVAPAAPPEGFRHENKTVNGINIHYVTGGTGEPLVLLHGFGQNWYMWQRILPELAKHFTIVAPDLPGLGESGKPDSGYEKKNMAAYIHGLVEQLGLKEINLAGHDIGLMVAYAYAAQYPSTVKKLALMDALLPGVEPVWSQVRASAWWFGFFAFPASGELVAQRERLFLTNFWPQVSYVKEPFTKTEADEFIRAYSVKGATTGTFHWFGAFEQDAKDNKEFMKVKLKMPLLAMGGEHFGAAFLADHCKLVAEDVRGSDIKGAGHWIVQENTEQVKEDLLAFFTGNKN
ncbi:MAG: alpha/beta hydrolase [Chitinophagaceae bacterium]|nr:MAG: alpha/beta hydrolase [Chitinophagaceae bacterium]